MAFNYLAGIDDSKEKRQMTLDKANLILNSLLAALASNYVRDNAFPLIAVQLKALAFEAARIIITSEDIYNDLIFTTTRFDFIWQNIESFLFAGQNYSFSSDTDVAVRSFLLALIQAYFQGATVASMEAAVALAVQGQATVTITELFLEAQGIANPTFDTIPLQHNFLIAINVGSNTTDIIQLQNNINFLISLIKPAHTASQIRFVFTEPGGTFNEGGAFGGKCIQIFNSDGSPLITPDGYEVFQKVVPYQICDAFHLDYFQYGYEDLRFDPYASTDNPVTGESPYLPTPTTIKTRYGPLSDGNGNLISNVDQVSVTVNGNAVTVLSVDALLGLVTLAAPVPNGATVLINYSYLGRYFGFMSLNDPHYLLNQFDSYDETIAGFRYSTVLWAPVMEIPNKTPLSCQYKYAGFDGLNSSLLNDASTLVFNQVGNRDKLNDATPFESYEYAVEYVYALNDGTPLYPLLQEKDLQAQDSTHTIFMLNDPNSRLNSLVANIIGGQIAWQLVGSVQKIYADLEVVTDCNGGIPGRLQSVEESMFSLAFDYSSNPDNYAGISNENDDILTLNLTGSVLNTFLLFVPRTGFDVSFSRLDFVDMEFETMPQIMEDLSASGFNQQIDDMEPDYKTKRDNYLLLNQTPTSSPTYNYLSDTTLTGSFEVSVDAANGRAYAVSTDGLLRIFDISDPENPVLLGSINVSGTPVSVTYSNGYVFIAATGEGLVSVRVTDPTNPIVVSTSSLASIGQHRLDDTLVIAVENDAPGFVAFDVSDPTNIVQTGLVSVEATTNTANDIANFNSYAYIPVYQDNTIYVVNYTNPNSPTVANSIVDSLGTGLSSVAVFGNTLYALNSVTNTLGIYNISTPSTPVLLNHLPLTGGNSYSKVQSFGKFLYFFIDSPTSEVEVWDASSPSAPVLFVTIPTQSMSPTSGVVYSDELLLVADQGDGITAGNLEIIDVSAFYATGYILNGTDDSDLLFPLPYFPVGEDLTQFDIADMETEDFFRPRFCLNSPNSLLNDPSTPYGIIQIVAGGLCTQSVADWLTVFELSGYYDGGPFVPSGNYPVFDNSGFTTTGGFVDTLDGGSF